MTKIKQTRKQKAVMKEMEKNTIGCGVILIQANGDPIGIQTEDGKMAAIPIDKLFQFIPKDKGL